MTEQEIKALYEAMTAGAKIAIAQALERHRKLGESIAVWQDGKVVSEHHLKFGALDRYSDPVACGRPTA